MAKIFVVDDEAPVRATVRAALERDGHIITEGADGAMVLQAIAQDQPDILVIDLAMPGKGGLAAIGELRQKHPRLNIIAISGGPMLDAAERIGADAILPKPFRVAELLSDRREGPQFVAGIGSVFTEMARHGADEEPPG